MLSQVQM